MPRNGAYPGTCKRGKLLWSRSTEKDYMDDPLVEMFAWLFVKTDEEIVAEVEVAALHSMFIAEDTRPERACNNG